MKSYKWHFLGFRFLWIWSKYRNHWSPYRMFFYKIKVFDWDLGRRNQSCSFGDFKNRKTSLVFFHSFVWEFWTIKNLTHGWKWMVFWTNCPLQVWILWLRTRWKNQTSTCSDKVLQYTYRVFDWDLDEIIEPYFFSEKKSCNIKENYY